jgi:hypothetical protein
MQTILKKHSEQAKALQLHYVLKIISLAQSGFNPSAIYTFFLFNIPETVMQSTLE